eukprot:8649768-Pyramimonas_sp.AAC.1
MTYPSHGHCHASHRVTRAEPDASASRAERWRRAVKLQVGATARAGGESLTARPHPRQSRARRSPVYG